MKKMLIVPVGEVKPRILDEIASAIESRFHLKCVIAAPALVPEDAYDPERAQYLSARLLKGLRAMGGPDYERMLAVTNVDLYVRGLNFIFGKAHPLDGTAIISLKRLEQEFYGLKPDERIATERALKEAFHEMGHTFGLTHCRDPHCVMHFSNTLKDTDAKSRDFCANCHASLAEAMKAPAAVRGK